jgi:hypothetical protein
MLVRRPDPAEYARCVELSEKVAWTVEEVLPDNQELDFELPFLPEDLAAAQAAPLGPEERLRLNHVRANSYVNLFVFVEEYIVATAMRHAQAELFGSPPALRALLRFADEEVKHQELFRRFAAAFSRGFGVRCDVIDNAVEVAGAILSRAPAAVMIATLHLEIVTQQHYVSAFRSSAGEPLEPHFRSLFKHHWLEEAQHAKIDVLELRKLAADLPAAAVAQAFTDYEEILVGLDGLLARQAALDLDTLDRAIGRPLTEAERRAIAGPQRASYREAFLFQGLEHPQLRVHLSELHPEAAERLRSTTARLRAA